MFGIQGWQWLIILVIVLLLFGATRLPKLARSLGESTRIFKSEVKTMKEEEPSQDPTDEERPAVEGQVIDPTADEHKNRQHNDQP